MGGPNSLLFAALVSPGSVAGGSGRIERAVGQAKNVRRAVANSPFGLDPARWGKSQSGQKIPESSFATPSPSVLKIRLPAALVANREFIVDARLDPATAGNRLVQLQVLTAPPAERQSTRSPAPILCSSQGNGREAGLSRRSTISAALSRRALLRPDRSARSRRNHALHVLPRRRAAEPLDARRRAAATIGAAVERAEIRRPSSRRRRTKVFRCSWASRRKSGWCRNSSRCAKPLRAESRGVSRRIGSLGAEASRAASGFRHPRLPPAACRNRKKPNCSACITRCGRRKTCRMRKRCAACWRAC